jgi:hypothetical protein
MSKKDLNYKEAMSMLHAYTQAMSGSGFSSFFSSMLSDESEKYPYDRLGDGYELRPIKLTAKEEKDSSVVNSNYCHLYHNDLKVSDNIFRKGGLGGKFKDGYCELIHYVRERKTTKYGTSYFTSGNFVIINHLGEIVLRGESFSSNHPTHDGGNLAHMKDLYYDLRTGKSFMVKSSTVINGKSNIIVEHRYDWYGKDLNIPVGIYSINKETCEVVKIDDIK